MLDYKAVVCSYNQLGVKAMHVSVLGILGRVEQVVSSSYRVAGGPYYCACIAIPIHGFMCTLI